MKNQVIIDENFLNFINYLLKNSSEIARRYFRKPVDFNEVAKDDNTPVTKADIEINKFLVDEISEKFPNHSILSEECDNINKNSEYKWVIDPIDGTSSFIIGRPTFGILIGFYQNEKPLFGVIYQPITGEKWFGGHDMESVFTDQNGTRKIRTSGCTDIKNAIICTTSPFYFTGKSKVIFETLVTLTKKNQSSGGVIYGGDCYLYGLLAMGMVDIVLDHNLKLYDFGALVPIIESAGGVVSNFEGKPVGLNEFSSAIACATTELHKQVMGIILEL